MASIVLSKQDFQDYQTRCPSCQGPVQVELNTDNLIHIVCPDCSFEQLFTAVYHLDPFALPLPCELYQPTSPY